MRAPSVSASRPPPIGGWDARNAIADMPEENAVILDNWFPSTDKVTLRRGFTSHATGMTGSIESLIEYVPLTGSGELYAAANGAIYDVSATGAVGAAVVTGLTNNRFQQVQIGTSGGQFLLIMNGVDTPQTYDGSSWADATMTGPTIDNLIWCNLHQRRLWFGEKDSLDAWYLDVNSITGAATKFPLAGLADLGGYIMAMGTWTRDGGDGQDDVAVFLTSEGQAIIYSGTDPSSSTAWALVGVFRIGKPIGRRCMIKAGADLIMVTQDGFVAASSILSMDRSRAQKVALSAQINKAVNDDVRDHGSLYGWQPFLYPRGTMLLFNIPQSSVKFYQYVFNTITGAPCRFTGINGVCWGLLNDEPYFGGTDGTVYKFDTGTSDNSASIAGDALQSFSYFSSPGTKKHFKRVEPIFESAGDPNAALDMNTDFQVGTPTGVSEASVVSSARWGVGKWGLGTWGTNGQIYRGWRGIRGVGRAAALRVRVSTTTSQPSWVSTNYLFVPGGQT
jgi:hypothetical protein